MICETDYCALDFLNTLGRGFIRTKGLKMSLDHRADWIYNYASSHSDEKKIYLLASTITKRVQGMDISKLTADMILSLCEERQGDFGAILDPKGEKVSVSSTFLIDRDQILMQVFRGDFKSIHTIRYDNGREDLSAFSRCFAGSIVISSLGIEKISNSAIELAHIKDFHFDIDDHYRDAFRKMRRELERLRNNECDTVADTIKKHPAETKFLQAQYYDYAAKHELLNYALKSFLYIYCSQTVNMDVISEGSDKLKRQKGAIRDYILVDSLWDEEINVINPFGVSGHFTHQPYGPASSLRKLIYIEPYIKSGYHRKSGQELNGNGKNFN